MDSSNMTKIFAGSGLSLGSALFGVVSGDSWWVVALGIAAGIALGAVGIAQRLQDGSNQRLREEADYWRHQASAAEDRAASYRGQLIELGEEPSGRHPPLKPTGEPQRE